MLCVSISITCIHLAQCKPSIGQRKRNMSTWTKLNLKNLQFRSYKKIPKTIKYEYFQFNYVFQLHCCLMNVIDRNILRPAVLIPLPFEVEVSHCLTGQLNLQLTLMFCEVVMCSTFTHSTNPIDNQNSKLQLDLV